MNSGWRSGHEIETLAGTIIFANVPIFFMPSGTQGKPLVAQAKAA